MLPDADDFPSLLAELAVDSFVAGHVGLALFIPEHPICFRTGVALGAAVPKAAVHKDSYLKLGESKVGLSEQKNMSSQGSFESQMARCDPKGFSFFGAATAFQLNLWFKTRKSTH